jgi:hypothetical protein
MYLVSIYLNFNEYCSADDPGLYGIINVMSLSNAASSSFVCEAAKEESVLAVTLRRIDKTNDRILLCFIIFLL